MCLIITETKQWLKGDGKYTCRRRGIQVITDTEEVPKQIAQKTSLSLI